MNPHYNIRGGLHVTGEGDGHPGALIDLKLNQGLVAGQERSVEPQEVLVEFNLTPADVNSLQCLQAELWGNGLDGQTSIHLWFS